MRVGIVANLNWVYYQLRWGADFRATYGSRNSGRCSSNYMFQQKNRVIAVFLCLAFSKLLFQIRQ